jgi:hypothetical protein
MTKPRISKAELRDALNIAYSMLYVIQRGGSFSAGAWHERMEKIELVLIEEKAAEIAHATPRYAYINDDKAA